MAKGIMYIDGQRVPFDGEKNVLAVIRKAGIDMPTFCYYSELSVYGACRMCVVEDERGKIDASCSMEPRDGMVIRTNTARLLKHRRMILELMLSSHCRDCTTCEKNGSCRLQELALRFGVRHVRFKDTRPHYEIDTSSPAIVRDPNKCILCGDCYLIYHHDICYYVICICGDVKNNPTAHAVIYICSGIIARKITIFRYDNEAVSALFVILKSTNNVFGVKFGADQPQQIF